MSKKTEGTPEDRCEIGKIVGVHGVRGDMPVSYTHLNTGAAGIAMLFLLVPAAIINKKRK